MLIPPKDDQNYNSQNLFEYLLQWRNVILLLSAIAFIASIIFSGPFFITPKYKSTVILFPTSSNSISKALLTETSGQKQDILEFGEDEQTEQMLQILSSNKIRDRVIRKYDLMKHYGIDKGSSYKNTRLYREYENNITFRRTEYMAVKITVFDRDAQMAADIANDIAELLDSVKNQMQKERAIQAFKIVENSYNKLKDEVQQMEDSLSRLRVMGVHDYETQAEMMNQQLAIELARGNRSGIKAIEDKLEVLAKYGGPYVSLRDALEHEKKQLSMIKSKYEEAKIDAEEFIPQKFVVDRAYKAERKSIPVRWVIVVISTISTFFLSVLIILIFNNLQYLNIKKKKPIRAIHFSELFQRTRSTEIIINTENNINQNITESNKKHEKARDSYLKLKINMSGNFYNINLLDTLLRWKIHLLVIVVAAAILAAIFSGPAFITPKFKSYAIVYPANISPYSDESETEQMLEIFQSQDIRDSIIKKFDLPKHYGIDPNHRYFLSTLFYEYSQNVSINKTPYEGVMIEVFDKDAKTACDMVNAMIEFYNIKVRTLHKAKFYEVFQLYQRAMDSKKKYVDSLENRLTILSSEYGLLDYQSQSREISRGYLRTMDGGSGNVNTKEVLRLKENIEKKGGELIKIQELIGAEAARYAELKLEYDRAYMDYDRRFTYSNIITKPYIADKKAYPVRWLIVVFSALSSLVLAYIIILVIENYKPLLHRKKNQVTS